MKIEDAIEWAENSDIFMANRYPESTQRALVSLLASNTTLAQEVERLQTLNEYANSRLAGLDILYEGNVSLRGKVKTLRYALIQLLGYASWAQKYCGVSMGMTNGGAIDNAKQAIKDTEVE